MKLWMKIVLPLAVAVFAGSAFIVFLSGSGSRQAAASEGGRAHVSATTGATTAEEGVLSVPEGSAGGVAVDSAGPEAASGVVRLSGTGEGAANENVGSRPGANETGRSDGSLANAGLVGSSELQVEHLLREKRDLLGVDPVRITIAATGDFLMHMPVVDSVKTSQGHLFDLIFESVAPIFEQADYTVANLETKLAGSEFGYRGFPLFNSPSSLAGSMVRLGVDLAATANNHTLDMGWKGLSNTLDALDEAGLPHIGTHRSAEEQERVHVVSISGVRVAFLNYTSSTNGMPIPSDHPYAVNMMETEAVLGETARARSAGAELVVAVVHWGEEYEREANEAQRTLADRLLRGGVDVIIGHHPHVVQPIRRLTVEREGQDFRAYVAYSLGNFVSNQRWRYADSGIILLVDVVKKNGKVRVEGVRYVPIYVQKGFKDGSMSFRVLPVPAQGLPESDVPFTGEHKARVPEVWEELFSHLDNPEKGITAVPSVLQGN